MAKRGQITVFVVLGLVILVIVGMVIYIASISTRQEEKFEVLSVEKEALEVRDYITSCLDDALKSAVSYCAGSFPGGGPKCDPYEEGVAERVEEGFCDCIPNCNDFSIFQNAQIEVKGEMRIEAKLTGGKKKIMVAMEYPIEVKKEGQEHLIGTTESPFVAQYPLEQTDCVPIKLIDNDPQKCEAAESKTVEVLGLIFTYNVGDKVAIGGQCIAC